MTRNLFDRLQPEIRLFLVERATCFGSYTGLIKTLKEFSCEYSITIYEFERLKIISNAIAHGKYPFINIY